MKADSENTNDAAAALRERRRQDLTTGSVPKNLWRLSWPQSVEGIFNALDQMADLFWAGHVIGFHAIGGIGVAQAYAHLITMARTGLDVGMQSMIARAVGARDFALATHVALQAFTLTVLISVLIAAAGLALSGPLLDLVGVSDGVATATLTYLQRQFIASAVPGLQNEHRRGLAGLWRSAVAHEGHSAVPVGPHRVEPSPHLRLVCFPRDGHRRGSHG